MHIILIQKNQKCLLHGVEDPKFKKGMRLKFNCNYYYNKKFIIIAFIVVAKITIDNFY